MSRTKSDGKAGFGYWSFKHPTRKHLIDFPVKFAKRYLNRATRRHAKEIIATEVNHV